MRKGRKKEVKLRGGRFNEGDKKGRRRGEKRTWGEEETAERGQTIIALQQFQLLKVIISRNSVIVFNAAVGFKNEYNDDDGKRKKLN